MDLDLFINLNQDKKNAQLIEAAKNGRTEEVEQLIKAGAHVDAQNHAGWTALICAAARGHVHVILVLTKAGAKTDVQTRLGFKALTFAVQYGHIDAVRALIQAGTNLCAVDREGNSALSISITYKRTDITQLLFSRLSAKQLQNEIKSSTEIRTHYNMFKQFKQKLYIEDMESFKAVIEAVLQKRDHLFLSLPAELMPLIARNYCTQGYKKWQASHAELSDMVKNAPLTFSSSALNHKRKAQNDLPEDERDIKKIKTIEDEMDVEESHHYTP